MLSIDNSKSLCPFLSLHLVAWDRKLDQLHFYEVSTSVLFSSRQTEQDMTIFYPKLSASKGLIPVGGDLWARQPPQMASMKGTNIIGILDLSPKLLKVSGQEILTSR